MDYTYIIGALSVFMAATISGLSGFGFSLILTPQLILLGFSPNQFVLIVLALAMITRVYVIITLRKYIEYTLAVALIIASMPGIIVGILVARSVPVNILSMLSTVAAVAGGLSAIFRRHKDIAEPSRISWAVASIISGFLGPTTSLNGVPIALLVTRTGRTATVVSATFATYFIVVNCISIFLLLISSKDLSQWSISTAVGWLMAALIGTVFGAYFAQRVKVVAFQRIMTWLIVVGSAMAIVKIIVHYL